MRGFVERSLMAVAPKEYSDSWHNSGGWESQFARVFRWLDRLQKSSSPSDTEDYLYAFFQNCHHLRDWSPSGLDKKSIDDFLNENLATRICRDLANMTKHNELDRTPSQQYQPSILREYAGKGKGWFEDDSRLVVVTNCDNEGVVLDAREVAKECLRLWCEFLPASEITSSVAHHFQFDKNTFRNVLGHAKLQTALAKRLLTTLPGTSGESTNNPMDRSGGSAAS
jgi:hypothetical protein